MDATLRIATYHSGNANEEIVTLDRVVLQGSWAGSRKHLTDPFGVSWQIVPAELTRLQSDPDPQVAARVNRAMLAMRKIIVADIEAAAKG